MNNVYIYWRFVGSRCVSPWLKYYKRPLTIENAKIKLAKLRATRINAEFCFGADGRIVKE